MTERAKEGLHEGPVVDRVGEFTVIECGRCGFKHVLPLPDEHALREIHHHEYYTADRPPDTERVREDLPWWHQQFAERFDLFEELLVPDRRRLLDVGSGVGFFLEYAHQRGWHAVGVEPNREAAAHARTLGVQVADEFLTAGLALRLGPFDVIHASEVLEHVPDPAAFLAICHGAMKPGSLLCVSVPNDYSPFQDAARQVGDREPWWVAPPHHLNFFDFAALERLLERCGFEPVRRDATFPIDMFLLMGDDYVGDDERGRACHARRMAFEKHLAQTGHEELRRALYRGFAELGVGRLAVVTARRR